MAKVVVEIDTSEQTMSLTIDGTAVDDVREFFVHLDTFDDDKPHMSIIKETKDEDNGLKTMTRISSASHDTEAQEAANNGSAHAFSALSGYIQYATQSSVQKNIGKFIGRKLR
jgi:hypothetical protein